MTFTVLKKRGNIARYPYSLTIGFWVTTTHYLRSDTKQEILSGFDKPALSRYVAYQSFNKNDVYKYCDKKGLINFLFVVEKIDKKFIRVRVIKDMSKDGSDWTGMETQFVRRDKSDERYIRKIRKEDIPLELLL